MKGNFDDVINPVGRVSADAFDDFVGGEAARANNVVSARSKRNYHIAFGANRCDHKGSGVSSDADGALSNGPSPTLHKDGAPVNGARYMYSAMSSDTGDAQARPLLERDTIREGNRLFSR